MQKEISLIDIFVIIIKNRWFIFKTILTITLITTFLSFFWPKTYKSTARFFPPPGGSKGISGLLSNFLQPSFTVSEISSEALIVILQSRTLRQSVIQKFDLDEVYGSDYLELTLKTLEGNIEINEIREGGFGFNPIVAVEFSFEDEEPERAQSVTKFFISKLDSIVHQLYVERAKNSYKTIEKRYLQNLYDLNVAENNLKNFQQKYGIFEVEAQLKAQIENIAELKANIIQLEIQLDVLDGKLPPNNSQYQQLQAQINSLYKKYNELIYSSEKKIENKVFYPLEETPELFLQYARLFRAVTIQNKVFEFIYPQHEQAQLEVSMQSQNLQVIDPAHLPTYKEKPKRIFIVLAGFIFSVFLSLFVMFFREYVNFAKEHDTETYKKIIYIKNALLRKSKIFTKP